MEEPQSVTRAGIAINGCGLIIGGALLGFFGCLGGIQANSWFLLGLALFAGAGVILWGVATVARAIFKRD